MTADEILRRVERAKSTAELAALAPEIGARERAIRARLAEIVDPQSAAVDPPPERRAAIAAGVDAVVKLEDEIRRLSIEVDLLARYEATLIQQQRELRRDELLASIPRACKSLPGRLAEARRALEGLDAALAALRETVAAIGEYSAAELPLPLTDDQLAELLELREALWQPRHAPTLYPPKNPAYPKSWALMYTQPNGGGLWTTRKAPTDSRGDVVALWKQDFPEFAEPARPRQKPAFLGSRG